MPELFTQPNKKRGARWLVVILIILAFVFGLFLGVILDAQRAILNKDGSVNISKVLDLYSQVRSEEVEFGQFWDVWDIIKEKYVKQPVDDVALFYGAMQGLVRGLDDSNSAYFPPQQAKEFAAGLSGEFEGIGAEIGIKDKQLLIVAPLPQSPAEAAGLKAGDKIYAIDDEDTFGFTLDEAVIKIRGPKGTKVKLTISHDGLEEVEEVSIIRDTIDIPTIAWEMQTDKIAYLRISYFNENTWSEFDKAVRELLEQSPGGLILDLRSNPGGFLETSVSIASEWIDDGLVVSEKFSDDTENNYKTRGKHRLSHLHTVVLVDEGSASGSEIVAGALQDYGLATLVGAKTYGKGSVQDFELLKDGSALKLTVAYWLTPKGHKIDGAGIMPDVIIEEMFSAVDAEATEVEYVDKGLAKALELLQ